MKNYTLSSPFEDIPLPQNTILPTYLVEKANEYAAQGKTTCITDTITGESYDFGSFDRTTQSVASALYKRGFRAGDIVIYLTYDLSKLHIFFTGVWRANGIPRASYPEDDEATLLHRVKESRAGWIYCEPEMAEICLAVASEIYWDVDVIVNGQAKGCLSIFDLMNDDGSAMPKLCTNLSDPALILSTSGTTGPSKGAVLSHEALITVVLSMVNRPLDKENPNLTITKGTHISGCVIPAIGFVDGAHVLVMHTIRPENVFEAIKKYQPRHIFAFPGMLLALVNHPLAAQYDFSCLQWASTGGSPLTHAMVKIILSLPNMKKVFNIMGTTEVGLVLSTMEFDTDNAPPDWELPGLPENSVGKLMRGVSAQFRDLETGEQILGPNETGELYIRYKGMFSSYYKNPVATQNSMTSDGFFRTGDVGFYDDDEFLYVVDRAKEIFKYYGNHVSPTDIENVINNHPAVGEVCVVGVVDPDGGGYIPRAFCVILEDFQCTEEEVVEFANGQLPNFKHVRGGVYFVKQLPKGKTGKVSRQLVEQIKID
ncbi:4-coumarate--CoA ligase 1-like [Folsomia candida]|uniref:4-coumarate--CoA ligase 1-like n=1 Tax=Folsomia candida TaxID=158441 RepID=UPI001605276A|nr:4-coumarate--CoA ligase 1-like [Folsomia candida]